MKKKSLVGWVNKDYYNFGIPNKFTNKKRNLKLLGLNEDDAVKVRITIEEVRK
jgi:hypothetical protein